MVNSNKSRRKPLFSTSLEPETQKWVGDKIKSGMFTNRTHCIESCVAAIARLSDDDAIKLLFFPDSVPLILPGYMHDDLKKLMQERKFGSVAETVQYCMKRK